jgi:hypothetical protein
MIEPTPEEILAEDAARLAAARRAADTAYSDRMYQEDEAIRAAYAAGNSREYERLIAKRRASRDDTAGSRYIPRNPGITAD